MDDILEEEIGSTQPGDNGAVEKGDANAKSQHKRANQSMVWDHFHIITEKDDLNPRAACNYCTADYACHTTKNGTSAMRSHLTYQCRGYELSKKNIDKKQKTLGFEPIKGEDGVETSGKLTVVNFSVDTCVKALAEMIIVDELPFKFVEGEGFRRFMRVVQPKWLRIPSRVTIAKECMKIFQQEKKNLKRALKGQRICLTTDTWTSLQNLNYMCLTAHFIDSDWKLHKKILNFCLVTNHKGETLGKRVEECLVGWGIDKILTVTVDNASSNNDLINFLARKTKDRKTTIFEHKFLHVRCCAHILNLIVTEGMKDLHTSIMRVRNVTKYVRSSPSRMIIFWECVKKEGNVSKLVPCLDVPTRWNSTYFMLERALVHQKAFDRMEEENNLLPLSVKEDEVVEVYNLDENGGVDDGGRGKGSRKVYGTPTSDDWDMVRLYVSILKLFHDATVRFSGSLYVTSNSFFMDMMLIRLSIVQLSESQKDPLLKSLACAMKSKFEKYWKYENVNALLMFGFVLDPRYKFKYVAWCLKKCYENDVVDLMVEEIKNEMGELYHRPHSNPRATETEF